MSNPRHNTNIDHRASWKKDTNNDLHAIWHKLDKLNISGGGTPTPITLYNKEAELVIENTNHTIGANTVHSYSIFVEQGTGTISINGGTAINIGLGYQKNVEFTATNDYSVVITSNINSKVRIVKIY